MPPRTAHGAALLCVALLAPIATAETTTLVATKDNTLYESPTGALSNGAGDWLFAGKTGNGLKRRGVLRFDLTRIPAGAEITSASLTLTHSLGQAVTANISVHRALASWGEGTSNADGNEGGGIAATTGDATWIHTSFGTSLWTTAGGDFVGAASASLPVGPAVGAYTWSGPGLVADVQAWIDGDPNDGWVLIGDEVAASGTSKRFSTHENPIRSERPTLVVEWVLPQPNPDLNLDGLVDAADLALLLGSWDQPGTTDLDGNGSTGAEDLAILLGAWSV